MSSGSAQFQSAEQRLERRRESPRARFKLHAAVSNQYTHHAGVSKDGSRVQVENSSAISAK